MFSRDGDGVRRFLGGKLSLTREDSQHTGKEITDSRVWGKTEERARDTESEINTAWTEPKATRMEGGFTFVALPLGLMFFLSGFIINVFQVRHSYTQ